MYITVRLSPQRGNVVPVTRGGTFMVLSRKDSGNTSRSICDGSDNVDVMKFFFMFAKVTTCGRSDEEKAMEVVSDLLGEAFYF